MTLIIWNCTIYFRLITIYTLYRVIQLCLSIWNRSPEAYKDLRASGMLVLPSGRLLQMYKNSCAQNPGLNEAVGQWMAMEASKRKLGPEGREGGIILDEMAIQVSGKASYITLFTLGTCLHPKSDKQNVMRKI